MGITWLYAPVADLDIEPQNPIIQSRSFGVEPRPHGLLGRLQDAVDPGLLSDDLGGARALPAQIGEEEGCDGHNQCCEQRQNHRPEALGLLRNFDPDSLSRAHAPGRPGRHGCLANRTRCGCSFLHLRCRRGRWADGIRDGVWYQPKLDGRAVTAKLDLIGVIEPGITADRVPVHERSVSALQISDAPLS